MHVALKNGKFVRIFFEARRAADPVEIPFEAAQRADEAAKSAVAAGGSLARGDPWLRSAEGTMASTVGTVGRDVARAEQLGIRLHERAGEIVVTVAAPIDV